MFLSYHSSPPRKRKIGGIAKCRWQFPTKNNLPRKLHGSFLRIWSHLLKKSLMGNFIFWVVLSSQSNKI